MRSFLVCLLLTVVAGERPPGRLIETSNPGIVASFATEDVFDSGEDVGAEGRGYELYARAIEYLRKGEEEAARADFDSVAAMDDVEDDIASEALRRLGNIALAEGKVQEAFDLYLTAIAKKQTASAFCDTGALLYASGNYTPAIMAVYKAVELDPQLVRAHVYMGHLMLELNNDTKVAENAYENALKVDPGNIEASTALASRAVLSRDYARAEKHLKAAQAAHPNSASNLYNLGKLMQMCGRWEDAMAYYSMTTMIDPDHEEVLVTQGNLYLSLGRPHHMIKALEAAVDNMSKDSAAVRMNLGAAYKQVGQFVKAVKSFAAAVKLDGRLHAALYNIGTIYEEKGLLDTAIEAYQGAIQGYNSSIYSSALETANLVSTAIKENDASHLLQSALRLISAADREEQYVGGTLAQALARMHHQNASFLAASAFSLLAVQGDLTRALQVLEEARALDEDEPLISIVFGDVFTMLNDWGEAAGARVRASRSSKGASKAHYLCAAVRAKLRSHKYSCTDAIEKMLATARRIREKNPWTFAFAEALARVGGCEAGSDEALVLLVANAAATDEKSEERAGFLDASSLLSPGEARTLRHSLPSSTAAEFARLYGNTWGAVPRPSRGHWTSHVLYNTTKRLRVGFVSANLQSLLPAVEAAVPRLSNVESFVYALDFQLPDAKGTVDGSWAEGLNETFDHFAFIPSSRGHSLDEQVDWMRGDRLHVLVALDVEKRTQSVLMGDIAPIQVSFGPGALLYGVTHVITDEAAQAQAPVDENEAVPLVLPGTHVLTDHAWARRKPPSATQRLEVMQKAKEKMAGVEEDTLLFGCPEELHLVAEEVQDSWFAVMARVRRALLVVNAAANSKAMYALKQRAGDLLAHRIVSFPSSSLSPPSSPSSPSSATQRGADSVDALDVIVGAYSRPTASVVGKYRQFAHEHRGCDAADALWKRIAYIASPRDAISRSFLGAAKCPVASTQKAYEDMIVNVLEGDAMFEACLEGAASSEAFDSSIVAGNLEGALLSAFEAVHASALEEIKEADERQRQEHAEAAKTRSEGTEIPVGVLPVDTSAHADAKDEL